LFYYGIIINNLNAILIDFFSSAKFGNLGVQCKHGIENISTPNCRIN